ncbi:hypothetical protein KW843_25825 [Acidovorax sp. sif1233]|uniref:hypothetical protein n=1 Tax=Acidovorax sp. sif1233 TaxID=2854792 RepID=UPI001C48C98D|nr:hypothetical protein [Acidovorax sp. sif1233]MBV7457919.1 hypothetical protein [Acidovorax sp. sif1233]
MTHHPLAHSDAEIHSLARFQTLQAGQYWRALENVPEEGIDAGMVLLIQSLRVVDDKPHTVVLRPHPLKFGQSVYLEIPKKGGGTRRTWFQYDEHRFLLDDFLARFEFEPDHQKIRNAEVQAVQSRISELQNELVQGQSNPALIAALVHEKAAEKSAKQADAAAEADEQDRTEPPSEVEPRNVPVPVAPPVDAAEVVDMATGTVAQAIEGGLSPEKMAALRAAANRQHEIATVRAQWIEGKTQEIAGAIQQLTPFYSEQAAAALAQTEDVRAFVSDLLKGIESLDLYLGKDVEVQTVREGKGAPRDVPLTFVQRKLLVDEELAVWADVDERFDHASDDQFLEALRMHDGLVEQIFPTERCVLVMATTRRYIDYGDPWANMARNGQNKVVYLLVRDGMNIHRVYSSVESHLGTDRLFPTKNDQEEIFRGLDGTRIKFEDVAYTDHLRKHERFALHFKRFLLLACGLDHRLKLFGDFYDGPASLHFVSMDFQERYCRFLHDDDASTMIAGGPKRPGFEEWLTAMNGYLRSGSRVLCNWYSLMNSQTAPGACKVYHGHSGNGVEFTSKPLARVEWAVVYRDGDQLCVDVRVQKDTFRSDRKFNCKVSLLKLNRSDWRGEEVPYLVLDAVDPEDLRWYIQHRGTRQRHLEYIRFFKRALKLIESDRAAEAGARAQLLQALHEGGVGEIADRPKLVDRAVIAWRAVNRGQPLPQFDGASPADAKAWKSLLDQMFVMAGDGLEDTRKADAEALARKLGYEPLRLVLTGDAKYMLYATPKEDECDNRLEPHAWVHRITMARDKAGFSEVRRRWEVLPERDASVTVLAQWPDPQGWTARRSRFASVGRKASLFAVVEGWQEQLATFTAPMEETTFARVLADWRRSREAMKSGGYVREMHLAIPIAVALLDGQLWYLCVGSTQPQVLIARQAPSPKAVEDFKAIFVRDYMDKGRARAIFAGNPDRRSWGLSAVPAAEYLDHGGVFVHDDMGVYIENLPGQSTSPLLGDWFAAWRTRYPKVLLWAASGVLDADGRLALDPVLSISLPEDYQPVRVREITLRPNDDPDKTPEYGHWFDISPLSDAGAEGSGRVGAFGGDGVVDKLAKGALARAGRSCGWSSTSWDAASPSKAIAKLQREHPRLVAAVDLPDAPQPPEGYVRWYVVQDVQS